MRGSYNGKYKLLYERLRNEEPEMLTMTFGEIEELIGFKLPTSARKHHAWWANQERGQGLAWDRAGYRTRAIDLAGEKVTFLRLDQFDPNEEPVSGGMEFHQLTIAEAKERLAQTFGVDPSQIEITIRA